MTVNLLPELEHTIREHGEPFHISVDEYVRRIPERHLQEKSELLQEFAAWEAARAEDLQRFLTSIGDYGYPDNHRHHAER